MSTLTKESPCVIQMIKDIHSVYDAMDDGSGRGEGINIFFLDSSEKFIVIQESTFPMPTCDGGMYMESEVMWEQEYSWNQMSSWYFSNRPFTLTEYREYNTSILRKFYVNSEEIYDDDSTMESFTRFAYCNPGYVPDAGHCHSDLGHRL